MAHNHPANPSYNPQMAPATGGQDMVRAAVPCHHAVAIIQPACLLLLLLQRTPSKRTSTTPVMLLLCMTHAALA
jgi:hypothetical protein